MRLRRRPFIPVWGMIKENNMGTIIYVNGEGIIEGELTEKKVADIRGIQNIWDLPAFTVSKSGCGFEISETILEGCNPYEDGVLPPEKAH